MKSTIISCFLGIALFSIIIIPLSDLNAQEYIPTEENLGARKRFQDDKFGMFIHWGVYSVLGDGEWVMNNQNIDIQAYEKLPGFFNPIEFNAREWVAIAKLAGMKYITITSKHHDGFAMYDSKVSDYNIVKATPFKRDIIKELADECEKQGLQFYLYYSQLDWHHPDYYPRGRTGLKTNRPNAGNWLKYLKYQNDQIRELAEQYNIDGFWFDGWWDQQNQNEGKTDWNLSETYEMIHNVNSSLLIGNNHHVAPFAGEDFQMFEKDLPGESTTGFATAKEDIGNLPLETCETINGSWGFNLQDDSHKSLETLIQYLVKAAGHGANFLLNVGPMPNGKIQDEHSEKLKEIGKWLSTNGETIYGTTAGPITPQPWGVSTEKANNVFLHILDHSQISILIPNFNADIQSMEYYHSGQKVDFEKQNNGLVLNLDDMQKKDYDTIIKISIK